LLPLDEFQVIVKQFTQHKLDHVYDKLVVELKAPNGMVNL
jgi:hypothetical protein